MKKVFFAVIAVAALTSCKKDWNCVCTAGSLSSTSVIEDMTKADADAKCNEGDGSAGGITVDCELL